MKKRQQKVQQAFESLSLRKLQKLTGLEYNFIHRTISGKVKRWTDDHTKVIEAAEKIIKGIKTEGDR